MACALFFDADDYSNMVIFDAGLIFGANDFKRQHMAASTCQ
jgi:hypothetical protein